MLHPNRRGFHQVLGGTAADLASNRILTRLRRTSLLPAVSGGPPHPSTNEQPSRASAACTTSQTAERHAAGDAETVLKHAADNKQQKRSPHHHKQDLKRCQSPPPQLGTLSGASGGLQPLDVLPPHQLALRLRRWQSTVPQHRGRAARFSCLRATAAPAQEGMETMH